MGKTRPPTVLRTAIWFANDKRCFYCEAPVAFFDLEIDHLVAESTNPQRVKELARQFDLGPSFTVNDLRNLVPSHTRCNRRKSNLEFSISNLRYYFGVWSSKVERVKSELESLGRQSRNESLLSRLAARIENGALSLIEVVRFLEKVTQERHQTTEPLVVCFVVSAEDLEASDPPPGVRNTYAHICDWLERDLMSRLEREIPSVSVMTEDARNGETLSIRIAFWNLDVQHLEAIDVWPWKVLEVAYYSEVYPGSWQDIFPKAVVSTYQALIRDDEDPLFGVKRCPQCGGTELNFSSMTDYHRDEVYYIIECTSCRWSDWTQ